MDTMTPNVVLDNAIANAREKRWRLVSRDSTTAEFSSVTGLDRLRITVDAAGEIHDEQFRTPRSFVRRHIVAIVGLGAGALIVFGMVGVALSGPRTSSSAQTPEQNLASLQAGSPAQASDTLVKEFGRELDILQRKCPDARSNLADFTYNINKALRDKGISEPLLTTITNVNISFSRPSTSSCASMFGLYGEIRVDTP